MDIQLEIQRLSYFRGAEPLQVALEPMGSSRALYLVNWLQLSKLPFKNDSTRGSGPFLTVCLSVTHFYHSHCMEN